MTSRIPRDSRLHLVRTPSPRAERRAEAERGRARGPLGAPGAVTQRRSRRPAPPPPEGTPAPAELARQARAGLASAVRIARWADLALRPETGPLRAAGTSKGAPGAAKGGKNTRTGADPGTDSSTAPKTAPKTDADAGAGKGTGGALSAAAAERAAAELDMTVHQVRADWDTARLAGLVEVHGDVARPGWRLRAWDRDDAAVLRGWVALFDAWSLVHPAPAELPPATVAEAVEAVPQLLSFLQLSAGPVPVPQLLDLLDQRVRELRTERCEIPYGPQAEPGPQPVPHAEAVPPPAAAAPAPDAAPGTAEPDGCAEQPPLPALLDWALRALSAVGALTCADGQATLTPLGSWAVWVKLEQICVAAQSPAGHIEQAADDMLRGCARLRPNAARAEYRAWLAARDVGSAVTELLDAARGEDALLRGLAFEALRVVGAPAEPDVRAVVDEPSLRPYALLWLAEHEGTDPEDVHLVLTRAESTWLWVDTAAAVSDHGEAELLVRHLESAPQPTVPALIDEVRTVGHPRTVQVLVALAAAHPDPALAKAVRRAAFQVHTGGV
ncbi:hypothetical protein [Streptomyces flavofungini]|uniref:Uncharacterized protein n=1 Tax=Streptomyces flavofungini TaxID=68200 RepID=A0ABS0XI21_9ACTN|nr:hypothetical protein [Streptomyces flavofungini]MBJ3812878.1 hypothetical protein [Streptomyces flavofungini]GHC63538.1 hypothetical protein GCM10010349_34100 [Streptomyces flavofungini]